MKDKPAFNQLRGTVAASYRFRFAIGVLTGGCSFAVLLHIFLRNRVNFGHFTLDEKKRFLNFGPMPDSAEHRSAMNAEKSALNEDQPI